MTVWRCRSCKKWLFEEDMSEAQAEADGEGLSFDPSLCPTCGCALDVMADEGYFESVEGGR